MTDATPDPDTRSAVHALADVRDAIGRAAALAGRDAETVTLIAVSKTKPAAAIRALYAAGQRAFGENRLQEIETKWPTLADLDDLQSHAPALHFIGRLQSNKAAAVVARCAAIHSLDRPSLVDAIARARDAAERCPDLFVQVDIGDEPQKGGCAIADLSALLVQCRDAGLAVAGLMAVPPVGVEAAPYFALLARLGRDAGLAGLSMGMSDDYETAVMLGATHVRVGSALFGARAPH